MAFNRGVARGAATEALDVVAPDIFAFFNSVLDDPARFGIADVTTPAVTPAAPPTPTGNSANSNPAHLLRADAARTHLFSDAIHPSGRGHELLGEWVLSALAR